MAKNSRPYRLRITVDLPENVYYELKKMKLKYNVTMTKYLLMALHDRFIKERNWDTQKEE